MLVANKHELEYLLCALFSHIDPQAIGNDYLVVGTVEKEAWREGYKQPRTPAEIFSDTHDFKHYYRELRLTQTGWFPRDQEPPVRKPLESREWVKGFLIRST